MLAFAGLPIFFMEVILGQYGGVGPNKLFELSPIFKGMCQCFKYRDDKINEITGTVVFPYLK